MKKLHKKQLLCNDHLKQYKYYNTQSTMKIPKFSKKKQRKSHSNQPQQQYDSHNIPSDVEQRQAVSSNQNNDDNYITEQVKIALAKKLIQKTKMNLNKNKKQYNDPNHDDFFLEDKTIGVKQSVLEYSNGKDDDNLLADQLKIQYMRSKNKLYIDKSDYFRKIKVSESIAYKGHTKCITAIQVTPEKIFSVSKDRSIIVWDRQTGIKNFITMAKGQNTKDHEGPILCMSYHLMHQIISTSGEDGKIKLWDIRNNQLIDTLKGHRNVVNGLKFGFNSNNLCSVSSDRTLKQWDCVQRGLIQTYYGHNNEVIDIDSINETDFLSSGNDHQNIIWKTQKETQIIFEGHDYTIDRVRAINEQKFISGCQDGSIYLWSQKKKKPIYKCRNAHQSWIGALDCIKQSNIFASGDSHALIKIYAIGSQQKNFDEILQIKSKGIVTDLKINQNQIVATACDQHRLGRWISTRVRNQIEVFKFMLQ